METLKYDDAKFGKLVEDVINNNLDYVELDLCNCYTTSDLQVFYKVMSSNTTIQSLYIYNGAGYDLYYGNIIRYLAASLETNTTLTLLDLASINIGDEGVRYIAKSLSKNSTLLYLNLDNNNISDDGAAELAILLKHNSSIISLSAIGNNISNDGVKMLFDAICTNTSLLYLDIQNDYFHDNVIGAIDELLKRNLDNKILDYIERLKQNDRTLTHLELCYNLDQGNIDIITKALYRSSYVTFIQILEDSMCPYVGKTIDYFPEFDDMAELKWRNINNQKMRSMTLVERAYNNISEKDKDKIPEWININIK